LVLLENTGFHDGLGLDIHIRTTQEPYEDIPDFYSYIESAAIRIGHDVVEFAGDNFWINGVEHSDGDLPITIGGFPLNYPYFGGEDGKVRHYVIDLNDDDYIVIYTYMHFMSVHVSGFDQDFASSVGLMGDWKTSEMLARDGVTVLHDPNEFGAEWQVREHEPKLFRTAREPQHPHATCKPVPEMTRDSRRHLRADESFVQAAEAACAHKSVNDFDFCVHDVLATKNLGMAQAW
jgi:hypothetical protein